MSRLVTLYQTQANQELANPNSLSISEAIMTLRGIFNDKSYHLFKKIALDDGQINLRTSKLSRKQYYGRLSAMMKAGLIKKKSAKYSCTSFGKIVYCILGITVSAVENRLRLQTIDSAQTQQIPEEELVKIIDTLITNKQIKEFLLKGC